MIKNSSKSYKLRNIPSIRGATWKDTIQKGNIHNVKIKVLMFIINFGGKKTLATDRYKSKKGVSVSEY